MFYRMIKLEPRVREPFRDNKKALVTPRGPLSLKIVNFKGVDTPAHGHGCLVAEIGLFAKVRQYRCRYEDDGFHVLKKIVIVKDWRTFMQEVRAFIPVFKNQ